MDVNNVGALYGGSIIQTGTDKLTPLCRRIPPSGYSGEAYGITHTRLLSLPLYIAVLAQNDDSRAHVARDDVGLVAFLDERAGAVGDQRVEFGTVSIYDIRVGVHGDTRDTARLDDAQHLIDAIRPDVVVGQFRYKSTCT